MLNTTVKQHQFPRTQTTNLISVTVHTHTFGSILLTYKNKFRSQDSVVGIATSYGMDDGGVGVQVPVGVRILTSPNRPDRL
jgi:hypothetical protein